MTLPRFRRRDGPPGPLASWRLGVGPSWTCPWQCLTGARSPRRFAPRDDSVLARVEIGRGGLPAFLPQQAVDLDVVEASRCRQLAREGGFATPGIPDDDDARHRIDCRVGLGGVSIWMRVG